MTPKRVPRLMNRMHAEFAFEQLKQLAISHGLKQVTGRRIERNFSVRLADFGFGPVENLRHIGQIDAGVFFCCDSSDLLFPFSI